MKCKAKSATHVLLHTSMYLALASIACFLFAQRAYQTSHEAGIVFSAEQAWLEQWSQATQNVWQHLGGGVLLVALVLVILGCGHWWHDRNTRATNP